jgi:arginase family enzyme
MDVAEVNSYYDPTGVTAQTAARLITDFWERSSPTKPLDYAELE